jgi:hypothetical protein
MENLIGMELIMITNGNGVYIAEEGRMRKCKEYA